MLTRVMLRTVTAKIVHSNCINADGFKKGSRIVREDWTTKNDKKTK